MEMRFMLVSGFRGFRTVAHRPKSDYWPRMHLHPRRRPRPPRPRRWWSRCVPLASSFSFKIGKFTQLRDILKHCRIFLWITVASHNLPPPPPSQKTHRRQIPAAGELRVTLAIQTWKNMSKMTDGRVTYSLISYSLPPLFFGVAHFWTQIVNFV